MHIFPKLLKHSVLIGILLSLLVLTIATMLYPGGSMFDQHAEGFDWSKNFISNLFEQQALNGQKNAARPWAIAGMLILPCAYSIFFFNMSKKIADKNAGYLLRYGSLLNVLCMFLIVTPLHDLMLNISITLFWTCIIVLTYFVFKTKLLLLKIVCVLCLLCFYTGIYLWAVNAWNVLPVMQKLNLFNSTILIVLLEYFTSANDFKQIQSRRQPAV